MEAGAAAPPNGARSIDPDAEADEENEDEAVTLEGTEEQLSLAIGGRKPDNAEVTLTGGALKVRGQFKRGEKLKLLLDVTIEEVAVRDHRDRRTNSTTSTTRKHTGHVDSAIVVTDGN